MICSRDSEAALEAGAERQGREMQGDLKWEKGLYAEQTQVGIYEAAPEEGASTTQTPLAEGPPRGLPTSKKQGQAEVYNVGGTGRGGQSTFWSRQGKTCQLSLGGAALQRINP